jgi:type II secretory pathway component PulF
LIEHQVPLVEALSLAAAASGDRRIRKGADELAERIRSGKVGGAAPRGLPPLLSCLILTNAPTMQLVKTLRQTAASLRERALRISISLGIYLPIVLSATVGAIIAAYYAILVMTPFYYLLNQLAQP